MAIKKELLDELLEQVENPEDLFGKDGLIKELTDHLGYDKHHPSGRGSKLP